ncbi:MAG: hypothetical protein J6B34_04865 [Clostridia bacterium]|nr:hypothetical protein [Clostridia bacterium]
MAFVFCIYFFGCCINVTALSEKRTVGLGSMQAMPTSKYKTEGECAS